jgi:hypothetical protein
VALCGANIFGGFGVHSFDHSLVQNQTRANQMHHVINLQT